MISSMITTDEYNFLDDFEGTKERIRECSEKDQIVIRFNDENKGICFQTLRPLVPKDNKKVPVLLLLRNPHPHEIKTGFYFPGDKEHFEHPFWGILKKTGYFKYDGLIDSNILLKNQYDGPFRFIFTYYLSFPAQSFETIKKIFSQKDYANILAAQRNKVINFIYNNNVEHVVCFDSTSFNSICEFRNNEAEYQQILEDGGIPCFLNTSRNEFRVYLTFPRTKKFIKNNKLVSLDRLKIILDIIRRKNLKLLYSRLKHLNTTESGIWHSRDAQPKIRERKIWFVAHQENLWGIDDKLIGFWRKSQSDLINIDDYIIYYRIGYKKLMGVFQVINKGYDLNPKFRDPGIYKDPVYQLRLKLLSDDLIYCRPTTETGFSFYKNFADSFYGQRWQVFQATRDDLKLILANPCMIE